MKKKMKKSTLVGSVLIIIMLLSSFGFRGLLGNPGNSQMSLPTGNIIDYQITPEQESYLIPKGMTIVSFRYSLTCDNCLELKNSLEQLTLSDNHKQILLQEIKSSVTVSNVTIDSVIGQKTLLNATSDDVTDALCNLLVYPPTICALRQV